MVFAPQLSQFSDASIPFEVAASLCGPAAAIAFARVNGRSPSLKEAQALAESVGWTASAGMAGPQSQQKLLQKMGIEADLTPSADWARVTTDVQAGKPVIISTPRHYFTVSDVDANGRYYVGTSGTDLKGGKEWLTADEIAQQGRGVNGALHMTGAPSRERQQFLEANAPGESARPDAVSGQDQGSGAGRAALQKAPGTEIGAGAVDAVEESDGVSSSTVRTPRVESPEEKELKRFLAGMQAQDAVSRRMAAQVNDVSTELPEFKLPGLPAVDLGWKRSRFALPRSR